LWVKATRTAVDHVLIIGQAAAGEVPPWDVWRVDES